MLTVKVAIVRLECVLPHFSVQEWLVVTATARCAGLGQTGYHWAANHLKWAGMAHFDREEHFRGVHIRVEIKPLITVHMSNSKL